MGGQAKTLLLSYSARPNVPSSQHTTPVCLANPPGSKFGSGHFEFLLIVTNEVKNSNGPASGT